MDNNKKQRAKPARWEPKKIETVYHRISDQEHEQMLQEIAELIVSGFPRSEPPKTKVSSLPEPKTPFQIPRKSRKRR